MSIRDQLADEYQHLIDHIRDHAEDAVISTRLAHADDRVVVVHAQIVASAGNAVGAHGSAEHQEAAAEIAENRALIRAMLAFGIPGLDDVPLPRLHSVGSTSEQAGRVVQFPSQETGHEASTPATLADADEPEPEDLSWTAFWKWARANGFADKAALESAIGQTIDRLSPAEARRMAMAVSAKH